MPRSHKPDVFQPTRQCRGVRYRQPVSLNVKLLASTPDQYSSAWWFPAEYNAWATTADDTEWLKSKTDLPAVEPLLCVTDSSDGSEWLVLETHFEWQEPVPPDKEPFEVSRRRIWYRFSAYVTRESDVETFQRWLLDNTERRLPEPNNRNDAFLGEFFWAPAYRYFNTPSFPEPEWTRGLGDNLPVEILLPVEEYGVGAEEYDCSIDAGYSIKLPCKWLADGMILSWKGEEGRFYSPSGELVAFDPSVQVSGPSALLIRKATLTNIADRPSKIF